MSSPDYIVPPRSWAAIGHLTDNIRVQFSLATEPWFPVMDFLERVLDQKMGMVELQLRTKKELSDYEGLTDPRGQFIILREDVYERAWEYDGRARFTVAHELGHFFLHTGISMARATSERHVKPFRRSEPQANQFAAEVLMPRHFMLPTDTVQTVVERHGVSSEAASNRLRYMRGIWALDSEKGSER